MSGFYAHGRLQDAEWLMRACMILNRDRPAHADPVDEDTPLNQVYVRQSAEFEDLLARIDPEGDIDRGIFPVLAFFTASEGWPVDIIFAIVAALGVWLFLPDWYGVANYVAYLAIAGFVAIQYLRSRRRRERARAEMIRLRLDPEKEHPLTLRILVRYRRQPVTLH